MILFSMLPSCRVIFPHPPRNIVKRAIPLEFVFYINNLFKIIISLKLEVNTNLNSSKPCIDIRSPIRMSRNLTPLK
jgi:hypothetical protein